MTETAGDKPPFPGFPGFPPAEMLDKMWDMMRLTPFGAAFPGMQPGTAQGFGSPLAAMSDMMSPLMNVEELDKRITDMRAVEQWLKLNLNMLQSAIQALEVQRATLSTLRAFGAFAQASMTQSADSAAHAGAASTSSPWSASGSGWSSEASESSKGAKSSDATAGEAQSSGAAADTAEAGPFDPTGWWNLLQSQFNQLAAFAVAQPGVTSEGGAEAGENQAAPSKNGTARSPRAKGASASAGSGAAPAKTAAKRAPARKRAAKPAGASGSGAASGEK